MINTAYRHNKVSKTLALLGFTVLLGLNAKPSNAIAGGMTSSLETHNGRHISVIGQAEVKAKPDRATLSLSAEAIEDTSITAKKAVDDKVNRFIERILKLGLSEESIVASVIYTHPQYEYHSNGPRTLSGYRATRQLSVELNDLTILNEIMDLSLKEQINQINRIELSASKSDELKRQATLLATQNATQQGHWLAKAFNAELGSIYSINAIEPNDFEGMSNQPKAAMVRMEQSNRGGGQYLHDELVFSATVKAVFDLKVKD